MSRTSPVSPCASLVTGGNKSSPFAPRASWSLCKRLAAKAGIEKRVHPHGMRHGWALSQVASGTSLPVIQQLLGHSSLATTAAYVSHIAPAKAVAEANRKTAHLAVQP